MLPNPPSRPGNSGRSPNAPLTTGRYVVVFTERAGADHALVRATLSKFTGIHDVAMAADFQNSAIAGLELANTSAVHFPTLGATIVSGEAGNQMLTAGVAESTAAIQIVEPEYYAYLSTGSPANLSLDYLRGFRDAANCLYELAGGGSEPGALEEAITPAFNNTDAFTWGLQATAVSSSRFTGHGIRVAVLDTGLDQNHPDFRNRAVQLQSFVAGATVQDTHGHGTHCTGTACGPQAPSSGVRRYGVAPDAEIFAGRVFEDCSFDDTATT